MPNNLHICKEIIFFISVAKNYLLIGNWKKNGNFWKGKPPNIGSTCIQALKNNWAVKKYNSLECYNHQLHKPQTMVLL